MARQTNKKGANEMKNINQISIGDRVRLGSYVLNVTQKPYVDPSSMSLTTMYIIPGTVLEGPGKSKGTHLSLPIEFDSKVEVL
jgi:hypothetical protein